MTGQWSYSFLSGFGVGATAGGLLWSYGFIAGTGATFGVGILLRLFGRLLVAARKAGVSIIPAIVLIACMIGAIFAGAIVGAMLAPARAHEMGPNLYRLVQFTPPSGGVTGPPSTTVNHCVAWNSTTGKVIKDTGAPCGTGSGSVNSVSVATANGFQGSSSGGSTPALTLQTNVSDGLLKSVSSALADAVAGTDYLTPTGSGALLTGISFANLVSVPTTLAGYGITDAYTKTQSDTNLAQWQPQLRVAVATTTVLPFAPTYSNGTLGVGATLVATSPGVLTVDGQTPNLANGANILVKNQAAPAQNGLYAVLVDGTVSVPYQLVRVPSYSTIQAINAAGAFSVLSGTVNALTIWGEIDRVAVVGTDPIAFAQYTLSISAAVSGPGSSTVGDFAVFSNTTGNGIADGGTPAASATTDTTNATNISSGTLAQARLPTGILQKAVEWDSNTPVSNGTYPVFSPNISGTIDSVTYYTGGTGSPTFGVTVNINGSPATCGTITVTSATPATTNCTAANTFTSGQKIELVIASAGGTTVNTSLVQVNYH